MPEDPNRTVHAQQAFEFTEVFGYKFDPVTYGKARPRRLKLLEPDGPSTAGGKQARQSMVLVPDEGDGGNLVVGFIDVSQKTAELRSFNLLRQQFKARFKADIDIRREEYDALLDDIRSFLKIQKIDQKIVEAAVGLRGQPKSTPVAETPGQNTGALVAMLVIGMVIGFGLGYLVFGVL